MLSELAASRGMLTWDYGMSVTGAEYMVDLISHIRVQTRPMSMMAHMVGQFFSTKKGKGPGGKRRSSEPKLDAVRDQQALAGSFATVNRMSGDRRGAGGVVRSRDHLPPRGREASASEFVNSIRRRQSRGG